ncbi:MerR family transcriptional regulator [Dyadobacter psychrotolerans]|uniref:MerR family transcriptional regulator n=1 Tax=Dyadobacter psychrotolerans TaxID=2541721 RepID=A0A4R5DTB1_9BACT|nr:MerR family transcriptional regulator [Dyadobacter psychrotolerans]TDE15331.1 MerR family transcriptional regulator [Dyadobacter psychrotolerans]
MSTYSIKDLERISNQKAHTIRIWEQRYGLLTPERTDTNIRYYNDSQLRKLLNVCTLINKGMKISQISKLTKKQIAEQIDLIIADSFQGDVHVEAIINEALVSLATYDALLFEELFSNSVKRLGLRKTYLRIIYPLLVRTGLMWIKDDLLPSQEHFLSNLIRQKLFAAIDSLPFPVNPDQTWLLFLNEEEDHEIGLLFAYYLLRQHGKHVIYLGARVPYRDLSNVIQQCQPTHIYTFFVRNQLEQELEQLLIRLKSDFNACTICISGGDDKIQSMAESLDVLRVTTVESLTDLLKSNNELY